MSERLQGHRTNYERLFPRLATALLPMLYYPSQAHIVVRAITTALQIC